MEREIQTMRIFFLEEFQSADSARSTVLQRAYKGHRWYNLSHFYFPSYNPFWYSFAPLYSVCIKHGTENSNHADLFPGRISKCGQHAIDSPTKGLQGPSKDIISLILTFRVITQFDIRSHHYTACVYSIEREIQTMRIYFLEEFQSADSARSTAPTKGLQGPPKI